MHWLAGSIVAIWGLVVVVGAQTGFFASLYLPLIAPIVATTIICQCWSISLRLGSAPMSRRSALARSRFFISGEFRPRSSSSGTEPMASSRPHFGCLLERETLSPEAMPPRAGNLYGTTEFGGASGQGVVFKLSPGGTETVLYSFTGGNDGAFPNDIGSLVADRAGNLYGTTLFGGTTGSGVVFKPTGPGFAPEPA